MSHAPHNPAAARERLSALAAALAVTADVVDSSSLSCREAFRMIRVLLMQSPADVPWHWYMALHGDGERGLSPADTVALLRSTAADVAAEEAGGAAGGRVRELTEAE